MSAIKLLETIVCYVLLLHRVIAPVCIHLFVILHCIFSPHFIGHNKSFLQATRAQLSLLFTDKSLKRLIWPVFSKVFIVGKSGAELPLLRQTIRLIVLAWESTSSDL